MAPVINMLAVLACVVVSFILGSLWYGPIFGKPWMELMGMKKDKMTDEMKKNMMKSYGLMLVGTFLTAYVMAHTTEFAMTYTKTYGVTGGLMSGFWNWLGFVAPVVMGSQLWEGKPWKLFLINGGYQLVSLLSMGVILATWR